MDDRILKWLYDIKIAIDEIDSYFEDNDKNFIQYCENVMLKRAIERNLEIVGEAINRILKRDDSFEDKITNAKYLVNTY